MKWNDEQIDILWFRVREGIATEAEQEELKACLNSEEGRKIWRNLVQMENHLSSIFAEKNPSMSGVSTSTTSKRSPLAQRSLLRWVGWGTIAALLMMAWLVSLQNGWIKGPSSKRIIGHIVDISGEISVDRGFIHVGLRPGMAIKEDDSIISAIDSRMWVSFSDGTLMLMGENSRLHLGAYDYQERKHLQLARGSLYLDVVPQKKALLVETPLQNVEVLGTRLAVEVEHSKAEKICLWEGKIKVVQRNSNVERNLVAGESLVVHGDVVEQEGIPLWSGEAVVEKCEEQQWVLRANNKSIIVEVPMVRNGEFATRHAELSLMMSSLGVGDLVQCTLEKNAVVFVRKIEKRGARVE